MAKSSSEVTGDERDYEATERTSLLPPSGISTNEREEKTSNNSRRHKKKKSRRTRQYNSNAPDQRQKDVTSNMEKNQWDITHAQEDPAAYSKRKMRKKKYKSSRRKSRYKFSPNESSDSGASDSSMDYRRWAIKRARRLEKESAKNMEQWKAAFLAKEEKKRKQAAILPRTAELMAWNHIEPGLPEHVPACPRHPRNHCLKKGYSSRS